ncbi:GNAT family N-acetyltransferase [Paenibacillus sp. S3N08]|uniref:GNAT family N-acetyltransferase n=2 Tax=Paenibacillus agricola TaxID=2716264 RepID=A0ABX0JE91_9BACL|nr:GNAT family N-acetyltransferase [Paenibacillus agricola]
MNLYHKRLYVFDKGQPREAIIRNYTERDFAALIRIQQESFPPPFPSELWWNEAQLREHITRFPEGALCVELGGELVGSMTALLVHHKLGDAHGADDGTNTKSAASSAGVDEGAGYNAGSSANITRNSRGDHSWAAMTDDGYIRNHQPDGDTLYIVDVCIRPASRKLGLGKLLMQAMYELTVQLGLVRLLGGGRMPGYHKVAEAVTIEQYVQGILEGRYKDPVITFLLRCGRTPMQVVPNYLDDEESCHYGLLMEWRNPFRTAFYNS